MTETSDHAPIYTSSLKTPVSPVFKRSASLKERARAALVDLRRLRSGEGWHATARAKVFLLLGAIADERRAMAHYAAGGRVARIPAAQAVQDGVVRSTVACTSVVASGYRDLMTFLFRPLWALFGGQGTAGRVAFYMWIGFIKCSSCRQFWLCERLYTRHWRRLFAQRRLPVAGRGSRRCVTPLCRDSTNALNIDVLGGRAAVGALITIVWTPARNPTCAPEAVARTPRIWGLKGLRVV